MVSQPRSWIWRSRVQVADRRRIACSSYVLVVAGALCIATHRALSFVGSRHAGTVLGSSLADTHFAGERRQEAANSGLRAPTSALKHRVALQADPLNEAGVADWADTFSFAADLLKVVVGTGGALWVFSMFGSNKREDNSEVDALVLEARRERERKNYVAPRVEPWSEADLAKYKGEEDPTGPLLLGVDGVVLNVSKARHLYGPGCEYHIFVGRDASRLLAKGKLEEETAAEASQPLSVAEEAQLQGWAWTLKAKYDSVGTLATSCQESSSMDCTQQPLAPPLA